MFTRRQFLTRSLQGASLLALGRPCRSSSPTPPCAAEAGKDTVLVVIELSGGNDGLNTVIPYADDIYHKARPTLRFTKEQVVKVNDPIGLHPGMRSLGPAAPEGRAGHRAGRRLPEPRPLALRVDGRLAVGRPEAQDRAAAGSPAAPTTSATSAATCPIMQVGQNGSCRWPFRARRRRGQHQQPAPLPPRPRRRRRRPPQGAAQAARRRGQAGAKAATTCSSSSAAARCRRYTTLDKIQEVLNARNARLTGRDGRLRSGGNAWRSKLQLVARLIDKGFGTRVFYVNLDGFDTHANQAGTHQQLVAAVGRRHRRLLPGAAGRRPRQARAGDDVLGVRPPRQRERQQGDRPRLRRRACSSPGRASRAGRSASTPA